jgi:hypothetical protein
MKLKSILTNRDYQNWPSWHIVSEWEDELSKNLDVPIKNIPRSNNIYKKYFKVIDFKYFNGYLAKTINGYFNYGYYSIYFEMRPKGKRNLLTVGNTVPIIIDFWDKNSIENFKNVYADCPYILVTSLEVLNFLLNNHIKNKLIHFPMTLPSIYRLKSNEIFDKKYDIVLAGRKNAVLWDFLKQFENKNPRIEYLYQVQIDGDLYYESNKTGIVGKFQARSEYMGLLKQAKIAFYSAPGCDGGEERTKGFNPVTPRFFELVASGCYMFDIQKQKKRIIIY